MNRTWQRVAWSVFIVSTAFAPAVASARVKVNITGRSDGEVLYASKGPAERNDRIRVTRSAGSILSASARAKFLKHSILIGNEVVSAGTEGDETQTLVRAGSLFFGKAKFNAVEEGATVENFNILYHLDGTVECFTEDADVPEGYAEAFVESQIRFNDDNKFAGSMTVDGVTGEDGGTGDFAGEFTGDVFQQTINQDFNVNFGTVTDGETYPLLFLGSTTVYYAADVPITDCAAQFLNSSSFHIDLPERETEGTFTLIAAKKLRAMVDPQPWERNSFDDVTVYVESENETLLENINLDEVQLFERIDDNGSVVPEAMDEIGDFDADGIPDRGIQFNGESLLNIMDIESSGLRETVKLFLIGETDAGRPFMSVFQFVTE